MRKGYYLVVIFLFVMILFLMISIFNTTWAYSYEVDNTVLFYEEDKEIMVGKVKKYLENVDDLLVSNSSFELSDVLVDNYDFLVHFALDYVLEHREVYSDRIVILDNYSYVSREGLEKNTDQYINLEEIYKITDKYFGVSDFEIINDDVNVIDNYISLIDYTDNLFDLKINNIEFLNNNDMVVMKVYYENDVCYLYTFENVAQLLKIRNIEVLI